MKIQLPRKLDFLLNRRSRYKIAYGGRGGGKSWSFGAALVHLGDQVKLNILCAREIQKTLRDSSKSLIEDAIRKQGLQHRYHITKEEIYNRATGTRFTFAGLWNNVQNLKSLYEIDICWIEEGHTTSQETIDILFPSIRAKNAEIWISYNPLLDNDPVHNMFVVNTPPPDSIICEINFNDNPWFWGNKVLVDAMEWCRDTDYDKYCHVWKGGTLQHSEEQVYSGKWERLPDFPEPPPGVVFYHGIDWGFSNDPMAATRTWEKDNCLYIDREAGGIRIDNDFIVPTIENKIETFRDWPSFADNSRPETISHVQNKGFARLMPCEKWTGCEKDAISFIRSYKKVYVHPNCTETIREFGLYKHKVDKMTGRILPDIVDKDNHYMDSIRYGLNDRIKATVNMTINPAALETLKARKRR